MIDKKRLYYSLKDSILEKDWGLYNFETLINNATPCWDDTAILVKDSKFNMIFDKISYELIRYEGYDIK